MRTATFRWPTRTPEAPALVLLHGAGPGNHDDLAEEAEALARRGIATLVMDKPMSGRGVLRRRFEAMAADAAAAARWLREQPQVDANRVGLLGVSEGGWVSVLAAARFPQDIDLVVLLSAPVVTPSEQVAHLAGPTLRSLPEAVGRLVGTALAGGPQLTDYAGHDSRHFLDRVHQPLLAIWGAADPLVPIAEAARRLESSPGPLSVRVLPGLGHQLPVSSRWPDHLARWLLDPHRTTREGVQPDQLWAPAAPPVTRWFTHPLLHLVTALAVAILCAHNAQPRRKP